MNVEVCVVASEFIPDYYSLDVARGTTYKQLAEQLSQLAKNKICALGEANNKKNYDCEEAIPNKSRLLISVIWKKDPEEWALFAELTSSVGKIEALKSVATPNSGSTVSQLYFNWKQFSDDEKAQALHLLENCYRINDLAVHIIDPIDREQTCNILTFYSRRWLQVVADVTEKTPESLLDLVSKVQTESDNLSLIYILFGDAAGKGTSPPDSIQLSSKGKDWYQAYTRRVKEIQERAALPENDSKDLNL